MPGITFYRQLRFDGGIRSGITIDGETTYRDFQPGENNDDPRLRWFVDLRCEGSALPTSPPKARRWLVDRASPIADAFQRLAEQTVAGIDQGLFSWEVTPEIATGVKAQIVYSAIHRLDGREMANVLRDVGSHWLPYVNSLKAPRVTR